MRLTLRTLLAYLDDTLEPAQAKEIGIKVAESDAARDLMERIKQVTRRRRLAAPPATGPSKLDPNTIAEYLDNEVSPEAAAEVEAICLASDVHLAEVAACHQILTLVLGEPMTVPPSAKQRMYGLVKGPEAIPFRKPAATAKDKEPVGVAAGRDVDDTLRLGLPPVGSKSSIGSRLLLFGGGFVAACLLLVAVWQIINMSGGKEDPGAKDVAKVDDKDKEKDKDKPKEKEGDKDKIDDKKDAGKDDDAKDKHTDKDKDDKDKKDKVEEPVVADISNDADLISIRPVGQYQPDEGKDATVCLQEWEKDWKRLTSRSAEVITGRSLMALPGNYASIYLPKGLRLTLCGNIPEILGRNRPIFESKVMLLNNDKLPLDLWLQRGQILITNLKDKPMQVRVRFLQSFKASAYDRPKTAEEAGKNFLHYDILLHSKGTQVMVGLSSTLEGQPFLHDPKDPERKGPMTFVGCLVTKGFASVKFGDVTYGRGPYHLFTWDNLSGPVPQGDITEDVSLQEMPLPPLDKVDDKMKATVQYQRDAREAMKKARSGMAFLVENGPIRDKLAEVLQSTDPQKPFEKTPSLYRIMLTRVTIRSMGAVDDVSGLLELLDLPRNDVVRDVARDTLINWLGADRDNDYVLYGILEEKYRKNLATRIMRLMHGIGKEEMSKPATYEDLIESLGHSNPMIRELAIFRLRQIVPPPTPFFSAWDSQENRDKAITLWRSLIPPGSLPPAFKKKEPPKGM